MGLCVSAGMNDLWLQRFVVCPSLRFRFFLIACEQEKSSNPLSPEVAGPMAGVSISTPATLAPGTGAQIQDANQPVSLVVGNPSTNSPRPVTIDAQIAVDSGFTNVVFSQNKVTPGPRWPNHDSSRRRNCRTAAPTIGGRKPADGANDSGWSGPAFFQVLQPIVIGVPTLKAPVANVRVANTTPDLDVVDGVSSGPHGPLHYQFQVAVDQAFATIFINDVVAEGSGDTHDTVTFLTAWDHVYYWRARIFDDNGHTGNWSNADTFVSPLAPATVAPNAPPSSGGGGSNADVSSCNALVGDPPSLSQCIHDIINPGASGTLAFEVTKRVAWALRGQGGGELIKTGGENIISWQGQSFSISRICFPDGHIYKIISDAGDGGTNGSTYSDDGFVDKSLYFPRSIRANPKTAAGS